jgi:hypothetical protein
MMFTRDEPEETPIEAAVRLCKLIVDHVPEDMCVAVFVFRHDPQAERVDIGFNANTTVGLLRRFMRAWLRETKPSKPGKDTVQ